MATVRKKSVARKAPGAPAKRTEQTESAGKLRRRAAAARASRRLENDGRQGRHGRGALQRLVPSDFQCRDLDPLRRCGGTTSVRRLIRVDEHRGDERIVHLVYEDRRYGWYCDHGRECPAIARAQRHARLSAPVERAHGLDYRR